MPFSHRLRQNPKSNAQPPAMGEKEELGNKGLIRQGSEGINCYKAYFNQSYTYSL